MQTRKRLTPAATATSPATPFQAARRSRACMEPTERGPPENPASSHRGVLILRRERAGYTAPNGSHLRGCRMKLFDRQGRLMCGLYALSGFFPLDIFSRCYW
ncbi:hypothetical protein MRX96_013941 [Rhipicephalus microplus]